MIGVCLEDWTVLLSEFLFHLAFFLKTWFYWWFHEVLSPLNSGWSVSWLTKQNVWFIVHYRVTLYPILLIMLVHIHNFWLLQNKVMVISWFFFLFYLSLPQFGWHLLNTHSISGTVFMSVFKKKMFFHSSSILEEYRSPGTLLDSLDLIQKGDINSCRKCGMCSKATFRFWI